MAGKLFLLLAICTLMALCYADDAGKKGDTEEVEGRLGIGGGSSHGSGFNRQGYNTNRGGHNQGSGGFQTGNRHNNVQGFRNREGYRTNKGFDESSSNRYGSGSGGFNTGHSQGSAGRFNQHGQQGGGGFLG